MIADAGPRRVPLLLGSGAPSLGEAGGRKAHGGVDRLWGVVRVRSDHESVRSARASIRYTVMDQRACEPAAAMVRMGVEIFDDISCNLSSIVDNFCSIAANSPSSE